MSKGERGLVYFAQDGEDGPVKIGVAEDVERRVAAVQAQRDGRVVLRRVLPGGRKWEKLIHEALRPWRMYGEWFAPGAEVTALFTMPEDEVRPWVLEQRGLRAQEYARRDSRSMWGIDKGRIGVPDDAYRYIRGSTRRFGSSRAK